MNQELIRTLSRKTPEKIVLLVIDGLGGLPDPSMGKTELETARIPNLDSLAASGINGLANPVAPGITPGSGPGHLGLFGYDPVKSNIGRGVLEAVGIDVELQAGDIAARGNFCTVDENGIITDRRAGRISTELCTQLCTLMDGMKLNGGIEARVYPVREHRFVVVFRGEGLNPSVSDSDPSREGVTPLPVKAFNAAAEKMASAANLFLQNAGQLLASKSPANMAVLRGFASKPDFPSMKSIFKLNCCAIALYPMYRGLARLVGMNIAPVEGSTFKDEIAALKANFSKYDFFFIHFKWTDSAGEDGNFSKKVAALEQVDEALPEILSLQPDVIVVSGDHSTPAVFGGHSWHPVPVLIAAKYCGTDAVTSFSEPAALFGGLGMISSADIMVLAMANARKLHKFGA